jgi:hypothetical protein
MYGQEGCDAEERESDRDGINIRWLKPDVKRDPHGHNRPNPKANARRRCLILVMPAIFSGARVNSKDFGILRSAQDDRQDTRRRQQEQDNGSSKDKCRCWLLQLLLVDLSLFWSTSAPCLGIEKRLYFKEWSGESFLLYQL